MLEIAVCDDEILMIRDIETLLQQLKCKYHIEMNIDVFNDGMELEKAMIEGARYDIIYMDIEMKYKNGLETAKTIRELDKVAILIYVTSYNSYVLETFEYRPFQFIVKPLNSNLFEKYFLKAYEEIVQCEFYFQYKYNKMWFKILVREIIYFESQKRTIAIICTDSIRKYYDKLGDIEKALKKTKAQFLRIHQSFLVNYKYIETLSYDKVTLTNGTTLSISEDRRKEISEQYCEIIGGKRICL